MTAVEPIRVVLIAKNSVYVPVWLAERYFKTMDLDARVEILGSIDKIHACLKDGGCHIGVTTPERIMAEALTGGPLALIGGDCRKLPHDLIAQPGIKRLADLKAKRFGVDTKTAGTGLIVIRIMNAAGLKPGEYEIVEVPGGAPGRNDALRRREIDAGLQPIPLGWPLETEGFSNLGSVTQWFKGDYQFIAVAANRHWLQSHRKDAEAFMAALRLGTEDAKPENGIAIQVAMQELSFPGMQVDETTAIRLLTEMQRIGAYDAELSREGLENAWRILETAGSIPEGIPFDVDLFTYRQ